MMVVCRATNRAATELVTWQRHLAKRNLAPRVIRAQVAATVERFLAFTAAHPRSTKQWRIHAASLPRRVDGSRRGSAGPLLVSEKPRRRTLFVTVTHSVSPAVRHLAGPAHG